MKMPALILTIMAVALQWIPANAQDAANPSPKERIEDSVKKTKELQKERISVLKEMAEQAVKLHSTGRVTYDEVLEAEFLVSQAELEVAEKESDRVALHKKIVNGLRQYEEMVEQMRQAGRGTMASVLKVKSRRLEAEIQLEQAKVKEAKESN